MKKIILLLAMLYSSFALSQKINGVYKSNFSSFMNASDSSKNYNLTNENVIVVDVNDTPYNTNGSVSITNKIDGESVTVKFVVKSEKKYYYDGIYTKSTIEIYHFCSEGHKFPTKPYYILNNGTECDKY